MHIVIGKAVFTTTWKERTSVIELLDNLKHLADTDYKKFNRKIIPTQQKILGVRLPVLRKIAKAIAEDQPEAFLKAEKQYIYELIMLEGMVLSYIDRSFRDLLPYTEKFLKKVDNWAQIDSTVANFRNIPKDRATVLEVVRKWLDSDLEFVVRAGLVVLLAHYVEKKYLSTIFELSQMVKHPGHYVHMSNGWLISACKAKFPEETMVFFQNNCLPVKTHNLAIQKSRESKRVSTQYKKLLITLKK
ncbi:MAG: DNA alkylation repair protein [Desulfocapsaceae bacterium]|nr:DNA alkylation repair protein [Desulfocapsaceae bacterium]